MKTILLAGAALVLLAPMPAIAQSPFDGTWKADVSSAQLPKKPNVYELRNGMYECKSCVPAVSLKADGMDHAVTGHPYYDMEAVKVVDEHTVEITEKKGGKLVYTGKQTVAPDGKTMHFEFSDSSATNSAPVVGKGTAVRVAAGLAGAHAVSGSWRTVRFSTISDNGLTVTYKIDGNTLTMTTPTGQRYAATMDGKSAAMSGDPGVTTVSVMKLADTKIRETDRRGDKVVGVATMTVSADGKSMMVDSEDKERGTTLTYKAEKQ
jgi:hypothetical protein